MLVARGRLLITRRHGKVPELSLLLQAARGRECPAGLAAPAPAISATAAEGLIAWDATPAGCDANGANCTGSHLDGDLDLCIRDDQTQQQLVGSSTYDSSWEMVDYPVTTGHSYTFNVQKWSNYSPGTYLAAAWYTYAQGQD